MVEVTREEKNEFRRGNEKGLKERTSEENELDMTKEGLKKEENKRLREE